MLIDISEIIVEDRIRKDFGDIEELAADIDKNGLINPITVVKINGKYRLIAGERRLRACKSIGKDEVKVNEISIEDAEQALRIEYSENVERKDFTFSERMELAEKIEDVEKEKAKQRQGTRTDLTSDTNVSKVRTDEEVAEKTGLGSREKLRKAKFITENADEELIKQLDEEQISIHGAYQELKKEKEEIERRKNQLEARAERIGEMYEKEKREKEELERKEPEVIEKEVIPDDYKKTKQKYRNMKRELQKREDEIKNKESEIEKMQNKMKRLEESAELNKSQTEEYKELKKNIRQLKEDKSSIHRKIEAATSISGLIVKIENMLQKELAPVKYSRAINEQADDEIVIKNLSEIIERVEKWCGEMRELLPNKNYIEVKNYE